MDNVFNAWTNKTSDAKVPHSYTKASRYVSEHVYISASSIPICIYPNPLVSTNLHHGNHDVYT